MPLVRLAAANARCICKTCKADSGSCLRRPVSPHQQNCECLQAYTGLSAMQSDLSTCRDFFAVAQQSSKSTQPAWTADKAPGQHLHKQLANNLMRFGEQHGSDMQLEYQHDNSCTMLQTCCIDFLVGAIQGHAVDSTLGNVLKDLTWSRVAG